MSLWWPSERRWEKNFQTQSIEEGSEFIITKSRDNAGTGSMEAELLTRQGEPIGCCWNSGPAPGRADAFVSCCSVTKSCLNLCDPWTAARQASLFFTISLSLLKLMSIELVMVPNHLTLCHPLLLLPSVFPITRVFSDEPALRIRWPKYWSFSISPSNEYSALISFRIDRFGLLAVQGTLKCLLQYQFESINSLVLRLLYGPTLTSIHDYWKNHSSD